MPAFLIFGEKPLRETVFVFLMCGVYFMANFLFFKNGLMLHLATPLLGLFASYLTVETYNFVRVSMERQNFFKMSIVDGLTGLFNIRYFKMLLETEFMLAEPDPNKKFSIVMMDIDHFKHFNDTYGHQVGDLVLKEVANVLKASVRSPDIVARYGGEEMIILLRGTPLKNALIVGEKIRKNVENFQIKDQHNSYKVTISLGVSTFKPEDNVETIIKQADKGLYKAKSAGRNRVETEEGIEELAGLYDIKHFYAILSAECQAAKKERNKKLCVIFSSIDNFQNFADIHGEHTGELVLEEVANILQAAVRSSDVVAEYEKGKMIVLLRGTPLNDGLAIAEKIRNTLKSSLIKDDTQSYEITVSLAISCVKAGDAADTIIERLKSALNKEPGINRVFSV
jgi:diguanylate cyclase (GGDEF)-like protein